MSAHAPAVSYHLDAVLQAFDDEDYDDFDEEDLSADEDEVPVEPSDEGSQKIKKVSQLPDRFSIVYKRATDLYLEKNYEEAVQIFKDIAKAVKNYAPLQNILADCYQNLGKLHEAFNCCKLAVKINPRFTEAWSRYAELADALGDDEGLVHALKEIVKLNLNNLETVTSELKRLVSFLDPSETGLINKYKSRLFLAEFRSGVSPDYSLALDVVQWLKAEKNPKDILNFFNKFLPQGPELITNLEQFPESLLVSFVTALLDMKQAPKVAEYLIGLGIMRVESPSTSATLPILNCERVSVKEGTSASLAAAVCIVMLEFERYIAIERLLHENILEAANLRHSKLFLSLAVALMEKNQAIQARLLMERLQLHTEFQTPEFYYQLGNTFEKLNDTKLAVSAYNQAVSLKPTFRSARFKILKLGLPVPSLKNIGTAEERQRTILLQRKVFENYKDQSRIGNTMEMLRCAADLVTSTFGHLDEMVPGRIIEQIEVSPYKMENGLKDYLSYAPAIATEDVPLEEFWDVCLEGCQIALDHGQYEDFLVIVFHALCTADFRPFVEKVQMLKLGVVIGLYYMRKNLRFTIRYFRDELIAKKLVDFSVQKWNFFYLLVVQQKHSIPIVKWASRWCRNYGYSKELMMLMANDALRRGHSRHALDLYTAIAKQDGVHDVSWQVLLNLGILYAKISTQYHLAKRWEIYSLGMMFLEKYALRRGLCPEVMYNKGRAAHLYGDLAAAIEFYKECLRLSEISSSSCSRESSLHSDCSFEAGYNLRAIYLRLNQTAQIEDLYCDKLQWKNVRALSSAVNPKN